MEGLNREDTKDAKICSIFVFLGVIGVMAVNLIEPP